MGNLTLLDLGRIARHQLGAEPGSPTELAELANFAGQHLMSSWQWQWAEGRSIEIVARASITLEGATWIEATLTLMKVGAFADYSFLSADTLDVLSGTGATIARYEVASRTSDDAIVLRTSIGAAADGQTDIEARMLNDQVALAPDFDVRQITAYAVSNGLIGTLEFVTAQTMLNLRSSNPATTTVGFWALLRHVRGFNGGQPVPRLELAPHTSGSDQRLVLYYRAGWRAPEADDEVIGIPDWLNLLYIEMFKAVVKGEEEPELGTVDERLAALRTGVLWHDAIRRDSQVQTDYGRPVGGWMDVPLGRGYGRYDIPTALLDGTSGP